MSLSKRILMPGLYGTRIIGVVFSRDRAMQLDCALKSFFLHCKDARETRLLVIYKATSALHERQYGQLEQEYDEVCFLKETRFRIDVLDVLLQFAMTWRSDSFRRILIASPFLARVLRIGVILDPLRTVLFMVDDNVFVREFRLLEVQESLAEHQDALGFSLRLGTNTTYCYALDRPQAVPVFASLNGQVLGFNWANDGDRDFGYPLEVSSSVYRVRELVPLLASFQFSDPNTLESSMAARADRFRGRFPYLLCYKESVTFCNPINMVQKVYPNRVRVTPEYSSERLARLFDEGYRINVESYRGFVPNACHQELDLVLAKTKSPHHRT